MPEFNGRSVADSAVLLWVVRGRYKRPLTSRDFICNEKEKRYRRNMMFLFAGHSAGLLSKNFVKQSFTKFLESQLHGSQRKSYLSAPFFFYLRYGWLVRGCLYMPGQRHELHHKICNLRYGTPGYGMSVYEITAKFKRFLLYKSHCSKAIQKWIAFLMSQNFSYKNRKPFGSRKYQ